MVLPERRIRLWGQRIVNWNHSPSEHHIEVSNAIVSELRQIYGASVVELESLLGIDLRHWPSHPDGGTMAEHG
jgi:hypothetical protein